MPSPCFGSTPTCAAGGFTIRPLTWRHCTATGPRWRVRAHGRGIRSGGRLLSVQAVSAIFYCAAPLALFLAAWSLTRRPDASFVAAVAYSLLSPAQMLAPEGAFGLSRLFEAHRFMLQAVWDETPRAAA